MKKTLALFAMLLISFGAMAQLDVQQEVKNTIEILTDELRFDSSDSCYYVGLTTSNRFDKPMIFSFGKGKKSAIQTIDDILEFMESAEKYDKIVVDNGFGILYSISKYDNFNVVLTADGYAGSRIVQGPRLRRWKSYIEDHCEY